MSKPAQTPILITVVDALLLQRIIGPMSGLFLAINEPMSRKGVVVPI